MSEPNPYVSPTGPLSSANADYVEPDEAVLASRTKRFFATSFDNILVAAVEAALMVQFGYFSRISNGNVPVLEYLGWSLLHIVLWLVFHGWLLITRGQAIGELIFRIQIVDYHDNRLLPFFRVYLLRRIWIDVIAMLGPLISVGAPYVLNLVLFVDSILILGEEKRCLHDLFAGSKVVEYVPTRSRTWGGITVRKVSRLADRVDVVAEQNYELRRLKKRLDLLERLARPNGERESAMGIIEMAGSTPRAYLAKTENLIANFLEQEADANSSKLAKKYLARTRELVDLIQ